MIFGHQRFAGNMHYFMVGFSKICPVLWLFHSKFEKKEKISLAHISRLYIIFKCWNIADLLSFVSSSPSIAGEYTKSESQALLLHSWFSVILTRDCFLLKCRLSIMQSSILASLHFTTDLNYFSLYLLIIKLTAFRLNSCLSLVIFVQYLVLH